MTPRIAFVDKETTGLYPGTHELWETGIILRDEGQPDREYLWQYGPEHIETAAPIALEIGRYHERIEAAPGQVVAISPAAKDLLPEGTRADLIAVFEDLLRDAVLVGVNTHFDAAFLLAFMGTADPVWNYHLENIPSLALGYLHGKGLPAPAPGSKSTVLYEALGLTPDASVAHTALGDAREVRKAWDLIHGTAPLPERSHQFADALRG